MTMRTLAFCVGCLLAYSAVADTPLAVPTVGQIDPPLVTFCRNDGPAKSASATSVNSDGSLAGETLFESWVCYPRQGKYIRVFSGCADVVWDSAGNILSVTPRAAQTGHYLPAEC